MAGADSSANGLAGLVVRAVLDDDVLPGCCPSRCLKATSSEYALVAEDQVCSHLEELIYSVVEE